MVLDDNGIDIVIDEFTNCLIVKESGREVKTEVKKREILKPNQYKGMIFDWVKEFQEGKDVYSLHLSGRTKVEGLIAIIPPNIKDEAINVISSGLNRLDHHEKFSNFRGDKGLDLFF